MENINSTKKNCHKTFSCFSTNSIEKRETAEKKKKNQTPIILSSALPLNLDDNTHSSFQILITALNIWDVFEFLTLRTKSESIIFCRYIFLENLISFLIRPPCATYTHLYRNFPISMPLPLCLFSPILRIIFS